MTEHHINGPSSLGRRAICPASSNIEAAIEMDTDNDDSRAGTMAHKRIEHTIKEAIQTGVRPRSGHEGNFYDRVSDVLAALKANGWEIKEVFTEKRLDCDLFFGSIDLLVLCQKQEKTLALVIDAKTGEQAQASDFITWQLKAYATLAFLSLGVQIVYANAIGTKQGVWLYPEHLIWRIADGTAGVMMSEVQGVIAATKNPNAQTNPVSEACRYCKGKLSGKCPAWLDKADDAMIATTVPPMFALETVVLYMKDPSAVPVEVAIDATNQLKEQVKLAQERIDQIKQVADGSIKNLGGTDEWDVQVTKPSTRIDYKACWNCVSEQIPNASDIERANSSESGGVTRIMPKRKKVLTSESKEEVILTVATENKVESASIAPLNDKATEPESAVPPTAPVLLTPAVATDTKHKPRRGRPRKIKENDGAN